MADTFDKFTERARRVLTLAQEEAQRFNHNYIGTEHLLLGLVREGDGVAARVLMSLGVQVPKVRQSVEFIIGRGEGLVVGEIGLTPRAKRAIELAVDEARLLNHHYIGTEHLLLGLLREGEGIAAGVLESLGVNLEQARSRVMQVVNPSGGSGQDKTKADMFDRFTERARHVLTLAQEEAKHFNHNYIGTEHILLGLVSEGDGVAARVLSNLGVQLPGARDTVERIIGRGEGVVVGEIGLTPRAKKVIELAVDEARRLGHHYIGTEHLLLGLVREGEGIAAGVLEALGVSLAQVRTPVMQVVTQSGGYGSSSVRSSGAQSGGYTIRLAEDDAPTLGDLQYVVPIVQSQQTEEAEATLLSLEVYADGFIVNLRVVFPEKPGQIVQTLTFPTAQASDDRGAQYQGRACAIGFIRAEQRYSFAFRPALDPSARELRLDIPRMYGPMAEPGTGREWASGPWAFTIALPPPEDQTGG